MALYELTPVIGHPQSFKGKPTSPFFRLPREVRDAIYHELWSGKPRFTLCAHKHAPSLFDMVSATYNPEAHAFARRTPFSGGHAPTLLAWLLTSKATMTEGLAQFQRHAEWHLDMWASEDFDFGKERLLGPFGSQAVFISGLDFLCNPRTFWTSRGTEGLSASFLQRIVDQAAWRLNDIYSLTLEVSH
jgi:hypothetical protein